MRNLPVAGELIRRGHKVTILTGKRQAGIAEQYLLGKAKCITSDTDAGLVLCPGTLAVDMEATIHKVQQYVMRWPEMIEQASHLNVDTFVVDVVPWALIAAKKVGIPSYLMANFTWLEQYQHFLPAGLFKNYEKAYANADRVLYYELVNSPTKMRFGTGTNIGFVARPFNVDEVKRIRSLHKKRIVFLSLGASNDGLNSEIDVSGLDYDFITTKALRLTGSNVTYLDPGVQNTQDYVKAADFCITKAGWSTISEIMLAKVPAAVLKRPDVPEDVMTVEQLVQRRKAIAINTSDLINIGTVLKQMEEFNWSKKQYHNNYMKVADIIVGK